MDNRLYETQLSHQMELKLEGTVTVLPFNVPISFCTRSAVIHLQEAAWPNRISHEFLPGCGMTLLLTVDWNPCFLCASLLHVPVNIMWTDTLDCQLQIRSQTDSHSLSTVTTNCNQQQKLYGITKSMNRIKPEYLGFTQQKQSASVLCKCN
jgi:hypothetical protein